MEVSPPSQSISLSLVLKFNFSLWCFIYSCILLCTRQIANYLITFCHWEECKVSRAVVVVCLVLIYYINYYIWHTANDHHLHIHCSLNCIQQILINKIDLVFHYCSWIPIACMLFHISLFFIHWYFVPLITTVLIFLCTNSIISHCCFCFYWLIFVLILWIVLFCFFTWLVNFDWMPDVVNFMIFGTRLVLCVCIFVLACK